MQYVLLIYQGTFWGALPDLSDDEKGTLVAAYGEINQLPDVTPGLPLGLPGNASTVRVQDGNRLTSDGPYIGTEQAIAGWYVLEADDREAAIELASRIPAARRGGAIEVRPVERYWKRAATPRGTPDGPAMRPSQTAKRPRQHDRGTVRQPRQNRRNSLRRMIESTLVSLGG